MNRFSDPNVGLVLLLAIGLAAFAPCLFNGFVYDDYRFIEHNPFMDGPLDLEAVFLDPGTMEREPNTDIYRPLRTLFFNVEHRLGGGRAFLHHLTGLVLHLGNTLLVWLLLRRLLEGRTQAVRPATAALYGAALFAVHPVQVEAVAWISSRGDQLAGLFTLLLLCNVLRESDPKGKFPLRAGFTILFAGLACLSKESGVIGGGLVLLAGLLLKPFRRRATFIHALLALATAVLYLTLRSHVLGGMPGQVAPHGGSSLRNFFFAFFGMGYQISLIFRPWFNNADYQGGFFDQIPFIVVVSGCGLCIAVLASALLCARRRPYLAFAVLFIGMALLPTSSLLITLRSLVNDRYLYLAVTGAALLPALLLETLAIRSAGTARLARRACMVLAVFLAGLSFVRCLDWHDEESLWSATLSTHPGSIRARTGLSSALFNREETDQALRYAEEAIAMAPPGSSISADAYLLAAMALTRQGREDQAARYLRIAVIQADQGGGVQAFRNRFLDMCRYLWSFDMKAGRHDGAIAAARMLVKHGGETWEHLLLLGQACRASGELDEAEEALKKAEGRGDAGPTVHQALHELYLLMNRPGDAKRAFESWQEALRREAGKNAK